MARLRAVRNHGKSQLFIDIGCKYGSLQGPCHHRWREEQSLIEGLVKPQAGSYLTSQTRGGQAVGCAVDAVLSSGDVSADRRQSAARILDEGTNDEVSADLSWFLFLYKLTVAVVHHDDGIRIGLTNQLHHLFDVLNKQGRAQRVAAGTLDIGNFCSLYCFRDGVVVYASVWK